MIILLNHGQWTTSQQATDTHKHTNKKIVMWVLMGGSATCWRVIH